VKMKVGRAPDEDVARVRAAREAIGPDAELFVDANGAYSRKSALAFAQRFAERGVTWFEEPVSSDDLAGLRLLRDRAPAGMDVAACCAVPAFRHLEWFADHVRVERLLFDGSPEPSVGVIRPDLSRSGLGLELKRADAQRYA